MNSKIEKIKEHNLLLKKLLNVPAVEINELRGCVTDKYKVAGVYILMEPNETIMYVGRTK